MKSRRISSLSIIVLFVSSIGLAQPFHREIETIPVIVGGTAVKQPFAGGVNSPNYQFVDIDTDGDLDLFVFDNDLAMTFYRNEGTGNVPDFKLRPHDITLPRIDIWFLFADLDGDGKLDLCTDSAGSGMNYYRNVGTMQQPAFVLESGLVLDSSGYSVYAGTNSIPALADIDADGDLDFFSGNSLNGTFNFYENIGTGQAPLFKLVTQYWQGISIFGDSCYHGYIEPTADDGSNMHGASAFRFADIDANGTLDFFFGDLFSTGIFFMKNTGTPATPILECTTNRYPPSSPVINSGFNMTNLVDIDGDGDFDLFDGLLAGIVQRHGFWFLENTGDSANPNFVLRTKDYLSVIDVGMNASPTLVDLDNDNDLDLVVGALNGELWYFRNDGTASFPSFVLADTAFGGITGSYSYAPAFVDIDKDGDKDLFIGQFSGRIKFYRNTGTANLPQFTLETSPVDTINVNQNASPTLVDIDGDGDLDLFVGRGNGKLSFYRNDGDSTTFVPYLVSTFYDSIFVGENSKPTFVDIDKDGDEDLFVGSFDGLISFYENIGTRTVPQFVLRTNHYANTDAMREAAPAFEDIDNDGDLDLFVGTSKGGLHFYRNDHTTDVNDKLPLPVSFQLDQNYPNPFNPSTVIGYRLSVDGYVSLGVFNILGQQIATLVSGWQSAGKYNVRFDGTDYPSGVYYYRLVANKFISSRSMIFSK